MNNNKKKLFILVISIIMSLLVASAGTYAWFKWRTTSEETVNINLTATSVVSFIGGQDITGVLEPVYSYTDGIKKDVKIISELPGSTFSLYLKVNSLPEEVKGDFFEWAIYNGNQYINGGNFENNNEGDNIVLLLNRMISANNYDKYSLYIWMDANKDIDSSVGGKKVDFDLYATGDSGSVNELG